MLYTEEVIRHSLSDRLTAVYGREEVERTLRELASDLIGATDPADLPANCRAWVDNAIDDAAASAARAATDRLLADLTTRFAAAPEDLEGCQLMQAVSRAQTIHVTEVR